MFRSIGPLEIGLIIFAIMIVFGVGKLPQVGGAIGRGIREFRSTVRGDKDEKTAESRTDEDKISKI
jgi:sec-independent protein translocase protein TatA